MANYIEFEEKLSTEKFFEKKGFLLEERITLKKFQNKLSPIFNFTPESDGAIFVHFKAKDGIKCNALIKYINSYRKDVGEIAEAAKGQLKDSVLHIDYK